jgi:L-alanine-DL-glutamate epimerase-like enolase superfamily enzyme
MSRYMEYRATRSSFGLNVLGAVVGEVETASGEVGIGVSTGGISACFVVERHAEGEDGLRRNLETAAEMRGRVGSDFFLAYDCWMALDVPYTLKLIDGLRPYRFKWVEEFLPPDDYWGYAEVRHRAPRELMIATGEHEATRWGFRMLIDMGCSTASNRTSAGAEA